MTMNSSTLPSLRCKALPGNTPLPPDSILRSNSPTVARGNAFPVPPILDLTCKK